MTTVNNRQEHAPERRQYEKDNPICEVCRCRRTTEVDHIVQKNGGTYELIENYIAVCKKCHGNKHADNLRMKHINIKKQKGEWNLTPEDEIRIFGKHYYED